MPLLAAPAPEPAPSLANGPTLHLDYGRGSSGDNVADFMYFVPLISPEPVAAELNPNANHRVHILSSNRRTKGNTFFVTCDFEFSGRGYQRNTFDYTGEIRQNEEKLKRGESLDRLLAAVNVEGAGCGTIEIEGTRANGQDIVNQIRMHFNARGCASPVTIALHDIRYEKGAFRPVHELVARVNTLTFQRSPGSPKMEVSVASIKPKDAGDGFWQNLKGNLKGMAANMLIPPLDVDPRGHKAMLDFGRALATQSATFTFPHASNLLPHGQKLH